MKQLKPQRVR